MTGHALFQHHTIPVINERSVNSATPSIGGVNISYNPSSRDYGTRTTAIILNGRVFFVLNGDHRAVLAETLQNTGGQGCLDYFIENIAQANAMSEHYIVIGELADLFGITQTAIEVLGQPNIDRLTEAACQNAPAMIA